MRDVAIILISGRSKPTLVTMMLGAEESISWASSHGHFIELSQALGGATHVVGEEVKPLLRIAETALLAWLTTVAPAGLTLENTGLSISLHYRNLVGGQIAERLAIVEAAVDEVVTCSKGVLEKRAGKLVWEIRPSLGWGKGKALLWVIEKTKALLGDRLAVLCCGDDATDEVRPFPD
jgi:trehalose-phosphatase